MIQEVMLYSRMALSLGRHLRTPVDRDPEGTVRRLIEKRGTNFLWLAKDLFGNPEHPYSQLFKVAGCSYADLEKAVIADGVEPTLQALMREGVYVSHDEFRGKKEIVRGGRHIRSTAASWLNGRDKGAIGCSTSGSSGRPIATTGGSARTSHMEAHTLLLLRELDSGKPAMVSLAPTLPGYGIVSLLVFARVNHGFERWLAIGGRNWRNLAYRAVTRCLVTQMRWMGAQAPYPAYLGQNDFLPVASYLAQRCGEGARPIVNGYVSSLTRVAAEAAHHGLDLTGCRALCAGEALTPAKLATMECVGMEPYATYWTSEFGSLGTACHSMRSRNCVHISLDAVALTTRPSEVMGASGVDSLCVTSLLPFAARTAINVEIGDTGVIEPCTCDCRLRSLGLHQQIRDMAAISKVTAQGMLIGMDDLATVLEEVLPARFGGQLGDYQIIETEGATQTEVVLRIRPGATVVPPGEVLRAFLAETGRLYGGSLSVRSWSHSNGIRAEFGEPVFTETGKFRPVRLLGSRTT